MDASWANTDVAREGRLSISLRSQVKSADISHSCLSWSKERLSRPAGRNYLNGFGVICLIPAFLLWSAARTEAKEDTFQWSRFQVSNQAEVLLLVGAVGVCDLLSGPFVGKLW